jgi:hypothetical protein
MNTDMTFDEWLTEVVHIIGQPLYQWYRMCGFPFRDAYDDGELPDDAAIIARDVCGRPEERLPALRLITVDGVRK